MTEKKIYHLIDANGKPYESDTPGTLGGHRKLKIYGRLDCPSALRYIAKGQYVQHRVFFKDEETAIAAGAAAITMHPRTRAQGYEGRSNWDYLKELVELVKGRVPVFGSGDIFFPEDAKKMLEYTGVDGVMFARGAMGKPFIFRQTRQLLETGTYDEIPVKERLDAGFEELSVLIEDRGEQVACKDMRKRFCAYSKGIEGGAAMRLEIVHAETRADYEKIFENYLK